MSQNKMLQTLEKMMKQRCGEMHTAFPGTIVSFDAGKCIATVKPPAILCR